MYATPAYRMKDYSPQDSAHIRLKTQVAIVGAGPAGLMLSHLLHRSGVDSVVLENRSRPYVEQRIRAGVLEQNTVNLLRCAGLGERLDAEGLVHEGLEIRFDGSSTRFDLSALADAHVTIYGQTEIVKDLLRAADSDGREVLFDVANVLIDQVRQSKSAPQIRFDRDGEQHELHCDVIAGCDGFHGVSRPSLPAGELTTVERDYPFAWLGILADVPPSSSELIYAYHERGFALHSMRSPTLSRLYIQCDPADTLQDWGDERIWDELEVRLGVPGWSLKRGAVIEKGITPMRSFVAAPMQYGRLFLAGDAAHIVPPTGAKGLNLALADVAVLAEALIDFFDTGDQTRLNGYSDTCLKRVWRAEHFSWWMTTMLHRDDDPFAHQLRLSQLRYLVDSPAAARSFAENYVGRAPGLSETVAGVPQ